MRKHNFFRGKGILLTCVLCITGVFLFDQSVMARKRTSETGANTQTEESTANTEQNTAPVDVTDIEYLGNQVAVTLYDETDPPVYLINLDDFSYYRRED